MTCYIQSGSRPINATTFASVEEAIAFARAPRWEGDKGAEITMLSETRYKTGGMIFEIISGENPTEARRAAREAAAKPKANRRSAYNARGEFRGGAWLSREMDRADSNF